MSLFPGVLAVGLLLSGFGSPTTRMTASSERVPNLADPTSPKTNVEPKQKDARENDHPNGRLMIELGLNRAGWPIEIGGEWTLSKPCWVHVRLGSFVYARVVMHRPPAQWDK